MKDSGKIKWGDKSFKCKPAVKAIIKGIDLKNRIQKKRRTHWIWITFDGTLSIRMGDTRVTLDDGKGIRLRDDVFYHKLESKKGESICQFVSKPLNKMNGLGMKCLTQNEEIAIVYTEIESATVDRRERTIEIMDVMRKQLRNYQMNAFYHYDKSDRIDAKFLKKRLHQVERLDEELNNIKGFVRDIYTVAKDKNVYFHARVTQDGIEVDACYDF